MPHICLDTDDTFTDWFIQLMSSVTPTVEGCDSCSGWSLFSHQKYICHKHGSIESAVIFYLLPHKTHLTDLLCSGLMLLFNESGERGAHLQISHWRTLPLQLLPTVCGKRGHSLVIWTSDLTILQFWTKSKETGTNQGRRMIGVLRQ
jgi:hypothetical protein